MAETEEKAPKAPKAPKPAPGKREGEGAPGKGKKDKAPAGAVDHAPKAAEGTPRLQEYYEKTVRAKIQKDFGLPNPHQVPTLSKIVLNVGAGEAIKQPKFLDNVVEELATITGQQPVRRKAKKSIANYGLREGQEIGASVTLRGARMWEFLDRFVTVALPRVRDFRGVSTKSFD